MAYVFLAIVSTYSGKWIISISVDHLNWFEEWESPGLTIIEENGVLQLLLLVGAKLEHIIVGLAQDVDEMKKHPGQESASVRPSDEYFWFNRPRLLLDFIHFILFQNAFEIAFFFWILVCHFQQHKHIIHTSLFCTCTNLFKFHFLSVDLWFPFMHDGKKRLYHH